VAGKGILLDLDPGADKVNTISGIWSLNIYKLVLDAVELERGQLLGRYVAVPSQAVSFQLELSRTVLVLDLVLVLALSRYVVTAEEG
jgi:hypothetical protein